MDQLALAKLVVGNKHDLDPTLSYLNTMQGAAGIIAFDRIGEQYSQEREGRTTAEGEVSRLSRVIDAGARKYFGKDSAEAVNTEERAEFEKAVAATGDDAPNVIRPKKPKNGGTGQEGGTCQDGDNPPAEDPVTDPGFAAIMQRMAGALETQNEVQRAILVQMGVDPDNLDGDLAASRAFRSAFVKAYHLTEEVTGDDRAIDDAAVAWAEKVAALVRTADKTHATVNPTESDPIAWVEGLIKGASG